ncbi:PPOX class F420-dependent oxidoreductase [Arenivirga flava]|nr:PPOX class F420-dependent oxidoreductase [Arenivirga flava]
MDAAAERNDTPHRRQWQELAQSQFVSVGTYRRNGALVTTPVWIAADGRNLVLTSEVRTGKVRRLRNDGRILMQVCDRFGRILAGASQVPGVGRLVDDAEQERRALRCLRRKYGVQFSLVLRLERFIRLVQRRSADRVIISIEPVVAAD